MTQDVLDPNSGRRRGYKEKRMLKEEKNKLTFSSGGQPLSALYKKIFILIGYYERDFSQKHEAALLWYYLKLCHDHFFNYSFELIIHLSL